MNTRRMFNAAALFFLIYGGVSFADIPKNSGSQIKLNCYPKEILTHLRNVKGETLTVKGPEARLGHTQLWTSKQTFTAIAVYKTAPVKNPKNRYCIYLQKKSFFLMKTT